MMNAATQYSRKSVSVLSLAIIIVLLLSIAGVGDASSQPAYAQDNLTATLKPAETTPTIPTTPIEATFEENRGQFQDEIQYVVSTGGYDAGLTKEGVIFKVMQPTDSSLYHLHPPPGAELPTQQATIARQPLQTPPTITYDEFRFSFVGIDPQAEFSPQEQQITTSNYIYGNPSQAIVDVKHFGRVRYKEAYQGVDVLYYVAKSVLHYEFYIQPQSDVSQVRLRFDGTSALNVDSDGSLVISFGDKASAREMRKSAPLAYQIINNIRKEIEVMYILENNDLTFHVGDYDPNVQLIIDPFFTYAGFVGGNARDAIWDVTVDNDANPANRHLYLVGETFSTTGFTAILGPTTYWNVLVSKIAANGQQILWQTKIGGEADEVGYGVKLDQDKNIYITGYTNSSYFPTLIGPSLTMNGDHDAFVTKLSPTGNSLIFSGYVGGNSFDVGYDITVDQYRNAYITGDTNSNNFPCAGNVDCSYNTYGDAFISRIKASGTGYDFSGFLGGTLGEQGQGLALDTTEDNIFVVGWTSSIDFPVSGTGVYNPVFIGNVDGFIAKINIPQNGQLLKATYIGTVNYDSIQAIAVNDDIFISGYTTSPAYPAVNFINHRNNQVPDTCFVLRITNGLDIPKYSGSIGGAGYDRCLGIAERNGIMYVTGFSYSAELSTSNIGPDLARSHSNLSDGFVAKVVWDGISSANVDYFGYVGGDNNDNLRSIVVDSDNNAYVGGYSEIYSSYAFPTTVGPKLFMEGDTDGIVAKINTFNTPTTSQQDTIGIHRTSANTFYLRNSLSTGYADIINPLGLTTDRPVVGDWNGDGVDTIGIFRPSETQFYLKNSNEPSAPVAFYYTFGAPNDLPIAGDWKNDGIRQQYVGVYRSSTSQFFLRWDAASTITISFGVLDDLPIIGDWNNDGLDSPGLYRRSNNTFYLTNQITSGIASANYTVTITGLTLPNPNTLLPLAGDWDGNGSTGIGLFNPSTGQMTLRNNATTSGGLDYSFTFGGGSSDKPLAGTWHISTYLGPLFAENPRNGKKIPPVQNSPTFIPKR